MKCCLLRMITCQPCWKLNSKNPALIFINAPGKRDLEESDDFISKPEQWEWRAHFPSKKAPFFSSCAHHLLSTVTPYWTWMLNTFLACALMSFCCQHSPVICRMCTTKELLLGAQSSFQQRRLTVASLNDLLLWPDLLLAIASSSF